MPDTQIRLLALDGGGVSGLSSLLILRNLMATINPDSPPRPCEYFDMIGGTSTGGIIAIMLGRLKMTVDECIEAYTSLSDKVFEKKSKRVSFNGQLQGRFDPNKLEQVIKEILRDRKLDEDELLKDGNTSCKVFVCATSKETSDTVCLTSYRSPRSDNADLLNSATIWQACRATSAATTFFDPIAIGPFDEEFVDGAPGENNPVYSLWNQAMDVWGNQLQNKMQCLVSIGTGVPSLKPIRDDILGIFVTLRDIATETEKTAQRFHRDKSNLDDEGRYYRFNVDQGLDDIGLEESKKEKEIAAATQRYVDSQTVHKQMRACANKLARRQYHGPYRTAFSLSGVPVSNHFIERPSDTAAIDQCLLPQNVLSQPNRQQQRRIFVLYGLGGIGKTQLAANYARRHQSTFSSVFWLNGRSEYHLIQSLANCAKRIPQGQLPERSEGFDAANTDYLDIVADDVLTWLAQPDNTDWLLIFDNVDHDQEQGGTTSEFDVRQYLPGDHGSVLITTRMSRLAQLGDARRLKKVDQDLSKAIFEQWYGRELVLDKAGRELLHLLDGLPLALAQAAAYCRETGLNAASYIPLYKQQWGDLMKSDASSDLPLTDYRQGNVGTTWTITFKAIEVRSESAANLLRVWAFIANKDLWHGLFQKVTAYRQNIPDWLYEMACSQVKFLDTIRLLQRYSIVEAQEDVQGSYSLHPVVHRWASHIQDDTEKITFLKLAILAVGSSVPVDRSTSYWTIGRRLLPHAEGFPRWIETISKRGWNPDNQAVLQSIHLLGYLFEDQGRLREAEDMYQRALQGREKAFGLEHPSNLDTMNCLGALYQSQGRLREAEDMYQRALQGREKALGPEHRSILAMLSSSSIFYQTQGRLDEAEKIHQQVSQGIEMGLSLVPQSSLAPFDEPGSLYTSGSDDGDPNSLDSDPTTSYWSHQESSATSLSYGASTDWGQVTQPHQPFTFSHYKESASDHNTLELDNDLQSVVSAPDDIESLAESRPGPVPWQVAVDSFVHTLATNEELLSLFTTATARVEEAKFVRNHQRLLKHLFISHNSQGCMPSQQLAVELLRSRRRRFSISHGIWNVFQKPGHAVMEKITLLNEKNKNEKIMLDRFLREKDFVHTQATDTDGTTLPRESSKSLPVLDHTDHLSDSCGDSDEDGTESSDEEHSLSNLHAAAEFLTSGQPFDLYKENLRSFLRPTPDPADPQEERKPMELRETDDANAAPTTASNQEEAVPVGQVHHAEETAESSHMLLVLINKIFSMLLAFVSEPPVRPGRTRIRWKCSCGEALFDDFVEVKPGALQALQTCLRELNETESGDQEDNNSPPDRVRRMRDLTSTFTWIYRQASKIFSKSSSGKNVTLPLYDRHTDTQTGPAHNRDDLHILMCIDKGDFWTQLYQQRLPNTGQDHDLFEFLREQYHEHRAVKSRFFFRSIKTLSLARFEVDYNSFASVHSHDQSCEVTKCVCIPPIDMIDNNEYRCSPAPKDPPNKYPVIGTNQLTHYFREAHAFKRPQQIIFNQLPKRACGVLELSSDTAPLGWGIHFKEGWDWIAIFRVIVALCIVAGTFMVGWTIVKNDISGAAGTASFVVGLVTVMLGYIAVRGSS